MSIPVGDHVLLVGDPAGTAIKRSTRSADDEAAKLADALLREEPERSPTDRAGAAVSTAEDYTERVEKGVELAEKLASRTLTDWTELEQWIEPTLKLIERIDGKERSKKALELVQVAQRVLALARRWLALVNMLRGLIARAGDSATAAWAQHELGTLHLAAGQFREADEHLEQAHALRKGLGDPDALAVTEQSLQVLCGHLRDELRRRGGEPRLLRRPVLAALGVLLLLMGGVAGAAIWPNESPADTSKLLQVSVEGRGSVTGGGIDCPGTCSAAVPIGKRVTLVPSPGPRSTFAGWSDGCSGTGRCVVTLDEARSVTARFEAVKETRRLRARVDGNGHVTSRPAGIDCPGTCSTRVQRGDKIQLRATPLANATFEGWRGGGCSGTGTCTVELGESKTVTARFIPKTVMRGLTVERDGDGAGTVTSDRGGIDCGTKCDARLPDGTRVILRAQAGGGSEFAGWSGGGCGGDASCTVTLERSLTITARFTKGTSEPITLTVTPAGNGAGHVLSAPQAIDCGGRCSATYDGGEQVTLRPFADGGSDFDGWSGGGCSGKKLCQVTMDESRTITATFSKSAPPRFALSASVDGDGSISADPACSGSPCGYAADTTVTLSAQPGSGSHFVRWGICPAADGATCKVTMNADRAVSATFEKDIE